MSYPGISFDESIPADSIARQRLRLAPVDVDRWANEFWQDEREQGTGFERREV